LQNSKENRTSKTYEEIPFFYSSIQTQDDHKFSSLIALIRFLTE